MRDATVPHLPAVLARQAERYPDLPAVSTDDGRTLSYLDWQMRAIAVAAALRHRVERGDVVALPFPAEHWTAYAPAYIGCQLAGAIPAPVRPSMSSAEWSRLGQRVAGVLVPGEPVSGLPAKQWSMADLTPCAQATDLPGPSPTAHVMFTSGTTGEPKAIAVEHAELLDGSDLPASWAGCALAHVMAPGVAAGTEGALLLALKSGMNAATVTPMEPARLIRLIVRPDVRVVLLVPATAQLVIATGLLPPAVEHVRLVMVMGSSCPPSALAKLSRVFPRGRVVSHYGVTEAGVAQLLMPFDPARPFAAGRPVGATEVRIVRGGVDIPTGETGEVVLRRRGVPQRRYLGADGASVFAADGWVHTGDLGRLDADGYLHLLGRIKDIVIRGGQNIVPAEAEQALLALEQVEDAAVFGVAHRLWGEMLVAAVVPAGASPLQPGPLRRALRSSLQSFKVPSRIFPVPAIPRTAAGKPDRRRLFAAYQNWTRS